MNVNAPLIHRGRGQHPATEFEIRWGIPPERVGLVTPTNRDLAVIARIGGHWYASCITSPLDPGGPLLPLHDECVQAYGIDFAATRRDKLAAAPTLPESAFSWPVYIEAVAALYGPDAREEATDSELAALGLSAEAEHLAAIHENGGHEGDVYVEDCPTCESWGQDGSGVDSQGIEQYQRESR